MEFKHLVEAAEKWCSGNPFDLIFAEEDDERRLDFYAEPGVSFYVLCPGGTDTFVSEPVQPGPLLGGWVGGRVEEEEEGSPMVPADGFGFGR